MEPRDGEAAGADGAEELAGEYVVLAPVVAGDVGELRRIRLTAEVAARWGAGDTADPWPWDDPDAVVFTVRHEGAIVGMVQYSEETEPAYRHASIDIFLDPAVHGRGLGRDAVRTLAAHLIHDRGHHRITIDPAADNAAAIRAYSAVGFRPVGVLRQYERDPDGRAWHDALLMDLLAAELT
jgi:aminoglycoside 6'-N-acetyltransferase